MVEGHCQSYGAETPYLPFLDAMRRALNLREEDTPEQVLDKVISQVGAIDASLTRVLPHYLHLLSITSSEYALPANLQGAERRRAFEEALVAIFTLSAKQRPLVVILEDWHWVDPTSDAVLKHLSGLVSQYPLMVVLLCRPEYDLKWAAAAQVTQIALKPLSVADSGALACTALGVAALPDALKTLVHQRTGGNPLFIEEVCHALLEEQIVSVHNHQAILTRGIETVQLPDTVQAVIRSRVDRLDKPTQEVLQLASVIGREFARTLLEKIPTSATQLGETLEALRTQDLIRQVRVVPEAEYIFKHVLTQIVVYETLLHIRRKALHELVGQAIEEVYAERIEEHYESLAYHYQRSDNPAKAIHYLELAGDKARAQYVLQQTVKNYAQAIALLETQDKTPDNLRKHIDIAVKWADLIVPSPEIIKALRTAQSYAGNLSDNERLAQATGFLGQLLFYMGDSTDAIPELQRVINMADLLADQDRVGSCYRCLGQLYLFSYARVTEGLECIRKAMPIVQRTQNRFEESCCHGIIGLEYGLEGRFTESFAEFDKGIRIAMDGRQYSIACWDLLWKAQTHLLKGDWKIAIEILKEGSQIADRIENIWVANWYVFLNAYATLMTGQDNNDATIAVATQCAHAVENTGSHTAALAFLAQMLAADGRHEEAISCADGLLTDMARLNSYFAAEARACRVRGMAAARRTTANWDSVCANMERSIASAQVYGWRPDMAITHFRYAELLCEKGDVAQAREQLHQATELFADMRMTWWSEQAKVLEATLPSQ